MAIQKMLSFIDSSIIVPDGKPGQAMVDAKKKKILRI